MAAQARDAATLVLFRESSGGEGPPELLLVRRGKGAGFGPGAHVFPGGVLETADYAPAAAALSPRFTVDQAARAMPGQQPPEKALGFFLSVIRETFEEVGVLLATRPDGAPFAPTPAEAAELEQARPRVYAGELDFYAWVAGLGVALATETLTFFSHWITPESRPRRFDTRFFLGSLPPGAGVGISADGREVFSHLWVTAAGALARNDAGEISLMHPTVKHMEILRSFSGLPEMRAGLGGGAIEPVLPKIVVQPDGSWLFVHPWEAEYDNI